MKVEVKDMLTVDEKMNIMLTKGDSACLGLTLKDGDGNEYDYSNDTVKMFVKRIPQDNNIVLEKTVEDGKIMLSHDDTESIDGYGDFIYAIKLYKAMETEGEEDVIDIYTPIVARLTLGFDVAKDVVE